MFFDATQFAPNQGGQAHPVGLFDASISDTKIVATGVNADNPNGTGKSFNVEFTTLAGKITNRYNLWNNSAKAVEISVGQLSALCHAVGIMRIDLSDAAAANNAAGAALRGGRCKIDVNYQLDSDKKPTQYVEVKRVLDAAGNEPGKAPAQQQPQQQGATSGFAAPANNTPMQQNGNGQWGQQQTNNAPQNQPNPNNAAPTNNGNSWSNNQQQQPQQNQQQQPQGNQPQQATWAPSGNPGETAPWTAGNR